MIVKMNNKTENFYHYMGKVFGSRIIQRQTNDRIYDDNNKEWYIYLEEEKVVAFVSIASGIIKNAYTIRDSYLVKVLKKVKEENKIKESIVPNVYKALYKEAGFTIDPMNSLKNFVMIYDK